MTFDEAEKGHRALWGWLAETGKRDKWRYPCFDDNQILNDCYACEYVGDDGAMPCVDHPTLCPIKWVEQNDPYTAPCTSKASPYEQWCECASSEERKLLAAQIRDLPWRKL